MSDHIFGRGCPPEALARANAQLQTNCPSPEEGLISLCQAMTHCTVPGERGSFLRRVTVDIDDLCAQIRWHLGQAMLLLQVHPEIKSPGMGENAIMRKVGLPITAQLLLRGFVAGVERVVFDDLTQNWRGGTVGGWIFHMMVDSAIYRSLSALDRLAVLAWYAAGLPEDRIYFRSRKMARIDQALANAESRALLEIAERPLLEFITTYRDGFSHVKKSYSFIAGFPPVEHWKTETGEEIFTKPEGWDADTLLALANASYHQFLDALPHVVKICETTWPPAETAEQAE